MERKRIIIIILFILFFIISIFGSLVYYKDKYTVYFETGTEESILSQYVSKNDKVVVPITPTKEGYVFIEWQLNGETFDFNSEIKEDTVLTAKWIKEKYVTITFNTNSDYIIESKKILKGESINELAISYKDGYEFLGWYINGSMYNNEEIFDDITLNAEYKNNKFNTTYKAGDKVKIIGNYSNTSYSKYAYNKRAIGWEREILYIIEDSENPYVVGNETGVTGFFKASSIEKI